MWFYTLCVTAIAIIIADAKGTLEPAVNKFEEGVVVPNAKGRMQKLIEAN